MVVGVFFKRGENMVLIDTWWNVNTDHILKHPPVLHVLIDTWWNVNNRYFLTQVVNKKSF